MNNTTTLSPDEMLAKDMGEFFYDPLGWVMYSFPWGEEGTPLENYTGPDEWQREILEIWKQHIRKQNFDGFNPVEAFQAAISSGHGIGKSAFTAMIILYIMSTRPNCKGVVTSNTSAQLKTKTWGELAKWKSMCITGHWFEYNNGKGNMNLYHKAYPHTWRVDAQTCAKENSEAFAGLHCADSTPFYIFDEASAIDDSIWEVAEGGLTDGEPMWFAFGNPTRNFGRFRECFRKFAHRWYHKKVDSRKAKMTNKNKILEWLKDWGENSDFFKVRVRGEFPSSSSLQFIGDDDITEAMSRTVEADRYDPLILAVDVARFGDDDSCLFFRHGMDAKSIPPIRKNGLKTTQLASLVAEHANGSHHTHGVKADVIIVDETGIGGGVVDRLDDLGYNVVGVNFGENAINDGVYTNRRVEMYGNLKEALRHVAIWQDDDLKEEVTCMDYGYDSQSRYKLEPKSDIKSKLGRSPDVADALALTFAIKVPKKIPPELSIARSQNDLATQMMAARQNYNPYAK